MKKLFILLLLFNSVTLSKAQPTLTEQLQQVINRHPQQDTFRVNRLNELIEFNSLPFAQEEKLAEEALTISRRIGYVKGEAYTLVNLGWIKKRLGDKDGSIQMTQQADAIAKKLNDPILAACVLKNIGFAYQGNDNKKALSFYLKAVQAAEKTADKKLLSECLKRVGDFLSINQIDFPKAMDYLFKAVKAAEEVNNLVTMSQSWSSLGALYSSTGDYENALVYFQKATEGYKKIGNKTDARNLVNNVGEIYRYTGRYAEALKAYREALDGEDSPIGIYITEANIADVYLKMDSLSLAFQHANKYMQLVSENDDPQLLAFLDNILSRLSQKKHDR